MKAYIVEYKGSDWCDFTHAESSREAKVLFWRAWGGEGEFIDIRARRVPALDDTTLSGLNIARVGYDDGWLNGSGTSVCHCELCKSRFDVKLKTKEMPL